MWKLIGGVLAILAGLGLGGFVIYAWLLSDDPDPQPRRPFRPLGLAFGAICLGIYWIKSSIEERHAASGTPGELAHES